jgi:hypothetical protein
MIYPSQSPALFHFRSVIVTFVIMPRHVTTLTSIFLPSCCSWWAMALSKLSRWPSTESSSFWNVSKPRDRSAPMRGV